MTSASSSPSLFDNRYQPALDGLRALSIVAVLLYHDDYLLPGGFLGVDVFFVLSGFLITSLLLEEWRCRGQIDLRRFYLRRALRLFPALAALLLVGTAFALAFPQASQSPHILRGVGYSLLYVSNWASIRDPMSLGPLGHTWSLAVEEQFYILWPLCLMGLLRVTGGRRSLDLLIVGFVMASALWCGTLFLAGSTYWRLYIGTDSRADSLLIGCAVAVATTHRDLPRILGGPRATRWLAVSAAGFIVSLMVCTSLEWRWYYLGGFLGVAIAASTILIALLSSPDWWITRALCMPPLVWIGRLSYSLYLWHLPIYGFVKAERLGLSRVSVIVLKLILSFVAAIASYYAIERPFLRLKRRLSGPTSDRGRARRDGSAGLQA
jgi:peptidoglycan/LPS O-acetylase OafA/YrhL